MGLLIPTSISLTADHSRSDTDMRTYIPSRRSGYKKARIPDIKRAQIVRVSKKYPGLNGARFVANLFGISVVTIYRLKKEYETSTN